MIGRIVGGVLGGVINRGRRQDPVTGAVVGAASMFLARRLLPARWAVLGATVAAAYAARKLGDMAERRAARDDTDTDTGPRLLDQARPADAVQPRNRPASARKPRAVRSRAGTRPNGATPPA